MSFTAKLRNYIPFVPNGYPIHVRIKRNRDGKAFIVNDRARFLEGDTEEKQPERIELKNEGVELSNVSTSDIQREKYFSWQYLKSRWRDYIELYEPEKGKYIAGSVMMDDSDDNPWDGLVDAAEAQKEWDQMYVTEVGKTIEAWQQESAIKKWLPYIIVIIVTVGQIVMMKQQSTTLAEQGDRIVKAIKKQSTFVPVLLAGTGLHQRYRNVVDRLAFWRD